MHPLSIVFGIAIILTILLILIYIRYRRKNPRTKTSPRRLQHHQPKQQQSILPTHHQTNHLQRPKHSHQTLDDPLPRHFSNHSSRAAAIRRAEQERRRASGLSASWSTQPQLSSSSPEPPQAPLPSAPQPVAVVPSRSAATPAASRPLVRRVDTETETARDPPPPYVA